jgi:hypothetical protein
MNISPYEKRNSLIMSHCGRENSFCIKQKSKAHRKLAERGYTLVLYVCI